MTEQKITLTELIQQLNLYLNSIHNDNRLENPDRPKLESIIIEKFCQNNDDMTFYANHFIENESLFLSILKNIISNDFGFKNDIICKWFYQWYTLNLNQTKKFVLSFIPAIIWVYLYKSSPNNLLTGIETLFVGIYNQEYIKREGKEKIFNPPILSMQSFIDKPLDTQQQQQSSYLTENTLKLLNSQAKPVVLEKPLPRVDMITTQSRSLILKTILNNYISLLSTLPTHSRVIFCEMASRISSQGLDFNMNIESNVHGSHSRVDNLTESKYNEYDGDETNTTIPYASNTTTSTTSTTTTTGSKFGKLSRLTSFLSSTNTSQEASKRIFISDKLYQELVTGVTYCAFQDSTKDIARFSAQMISQRANYDLIPELILSTQSLLNILK